MDVVYIKGSNIKKYNAWLSPKNKSMISAKAILEALNEPVLLLDCSLQPIMANHAFYKAFNMSSKKLEGKSLKGIFSEGDKEPGLNMILEQVLTHEKRVTDIEIMINISSNVRKILTINARTLNFTENQNKMVLLEFRDITREKEVEQKVQKLNDMLQQHGAELEAINRELESFTRYVSHDLRTPLRFTNRIAHMLLEDHHNLLPADATEKINMILDSTRQMGELIENLLIFSRVSDEPMKKRRIDTGRLVREVLKELTSDQEYGDVEVVINELPPCRADRALLKQVFINLLANAFKFTRASKQAKIHIGFSEANDETIYFVRDNGVGFDMIHSESIFLVFHRFNKDHNFEGSGIGLALVKRIIERHDGRIWAESETDKGATFYFSLGE